MPIIYERREKRGKAGLTVTGFEGRVRHLQIPEEATIESADGSKETLPVTAIGRHAFDENEDIREVTLPESITEIGPFAFYRCRGLEKITLSDSVVDYYDGAIRENRNLKEIAVHVRKGNYRILKDILGDNTEVLHFHLFIPEGEAFLTFPEYHNEDWEDTYARVIHPRIVGAGYAYREMVSRTSIDFDGYDRQFARTETEFPEIPARIAADRLAYPLKLEKAAESMYETYFLEHAAEILPGYIEADDKERLEVFLAHIELPEVLIDQAVKLASDGGHTEICAMLMEYDRKHTAAVPEPESFSWEDL